MYTVRRTLFTTERYVLEPIHVVDLPIILIPVIYLLAPVLDMPLMLRQYIISKFALVSDFVKTFVP